MRYRKRYQELIWLKTEERERRLSRRGRTDKCSSAVNLSVSLTSTTILPLPRYVALYRVGTTWLNSGESTTTISLPVIPQVLLNDRSTRNWSTTQFSKVEYLVVYPQVTTFVVMIWHVNPSKQRCYSAVHSVPASAQRPITH